MLYEVITLTVFESTGGYELLATSLLAEAGLPVVIVNPRQVRNFAKATGILAKTDAIDARVRITSYNVCYTKLLRLHTGPSQGRPPLSRLSQDGACLFRKNRHFPHYARSGYP